MNYYNDIDPFAAAWLRELIREGLLPDGTVDERSIVEVVPSDLGPFRQCHFFAGIGGWPHALALAGHGALECWTASLPCQPLSVAGQGRGDADERHLWPAFYRLVAECRPAIIVGEQVASLDGREWLAGVRLDLEAAGYACGAANLPACGVGAPHRRERLYWCALSLADAKGDRGNGDLRDHQRQALREVVRGSAGVRGVGDAEGQGSQGRWSEHSETARGLVGGQRGLSGQAFWSGAEWRVGADGKARRVGRQIRRIFNGIPPSLGASGNEGAETEEVSNGAEIAHVPRQGVPNMREGVQPQSIREPMGRQREVPAEEILLSELREYEAGDREGAISQEGASISGGVMRDMRRNDRAACPPQGRGHHEQPAVEPSDVVRFLSSALALGQWQDDAEEAVGLQNLREAIEGVGFVPETLSAVPQVWRSMPDEARQCVGRLLCARGLVWEPMAMLTRNQPNRVGLLRGLGNAIVPQVAALFVEAMMWENRHE